MTRPEISRHVLDVYATELRRQADAAEALADMAGDGQPWTGRARGLMEAHGLLMNMLAAGQAPITLGAEVRFLSPEQAKPQLADIDAHYDVMQIRDGMVAVKCTIYRPRGDMPGARHWAPLTAVECCSDGHRCPTADPAFAAWEGGAR